MTDLLTRPVPRAPAPPAAPPREALDAPATALAGTAAHDLAIVVAPSTGRFRPTVERDAEVAAGTVIGHVTGARGRADVVVTPTAGSVADLLARPQQLVYRGQGLAWLRRAAVADAA